MQPPSREKRKRYQPMAEINVTPMVDIMLVLLIVFMVAAPLLTVGVPVNLPKAGAKPLRGDEEPLGISVNAQGQIFLQAIVGTGYEQRIYVRGDEAVSYGRVANVVARINAAGFARVALVTDTPKGQNK
jgi:biopolymer transport protein TolR